MGPQFLCDWGRSRIHEKGRGRHRPGGQESRSNCPAKARIGTTQAPELVHDSREPYVKHDELVALQFQDPSTDKTLGLIVQWNCHPETLSSKNTEVSADFVASTVAHLQDRQQVSRGLPDRYQSADCLVRSASR